MSGIGIPNRSIINGGSFSCAIVAASWHKDIVSALIWGAVEYLKLSKIKYEIFEVPGSFELPLACSKKLNSDFDFAVALGVILRGETPHFDFVAAGATNGLMTVMLNSGKPIGFGILTCDNEKQALARADKTNIEFNKGAEAAHAAASLLLINEKKKSI